MVAMPKFRSQRRNRRDKEETEIPREGSDRTLTPSGTEYIPGVDIKRATRTRKIFIYLSTFFFVLSVIFLILVLIGNLYNKPVLRNTYFFKLDLANIIPASVENAQLVNSLARSIGLHDFYTVGLWGFCEGYNDEGVTYCSSPKALYWFNPVEILLNELLSGATIALPADINNILKLIRIVSHIMFGFFLTGICMNFVSIFLIWIAIYSRWWSLFVGLWTFFAAFFTTVATVIVTAMFIIFKNVITSEEDLNIGAALGTQMFVFMWIATAFTLFAWIINWGMCCCCASRRDVKTGRRRGSSKAYGLGRGTGMSGASDSVRDGSNRTPDNVAQNEKHENDGSKRGKRAFGGFGKKRDATEV